MKNNNKKTLAEKLNNQDKSSGLSSFSTPSPSAEKPEGIPSANLLNSPDQTKRITPLNSRKSPLKKVFAVIALIAFFGIGMAGVYISQNQFEDRSAKAPNAPESQPAAFVNKASCTLSFTVKPLITPTVTPTTTPTPTVTVTPTPSPTPTLNECGYTPCVDDSECNDSLICITADGGENYCGKEEYKVACTADPSVATCCQAEPTPTPTPTDEPTPTPTEELTPTPTPIFCGYSSCSSNFDCDEGLICISASDGDNYCSSPDYRTACENNPSTTTCCYAPGTTVTPTTPSSGTPQPDLPAELPQSGPENWLNYLQVGLGTLGIGALLLLFL